MLCYTITKERIKTRLKDNIPKEVQKIYNTLEEKGFEVYLVGGCVRNLLMGTKPKDWDLTTNAKPEEITKTFEKSFYDNNFGTVGLPTETSGVVEVTTYRTEHGYSDKRHPEKVSWGKTIHDDLSRRDFTINAIALKLSDEDHLIDPFKGGLDIKKKIIRTVGNPSERFDEDALRILRAIRFATVLSFEIEKETWKEIVKNAKHITQISNERVRDELLKILASEDPAKGIELFRESGLLEYVLPELVEGIGVSQVRPGRHHTTDVYTHNLLSLKFCPSKDPIVRLATLLHDVGKPKSKGTDKEGFVTFYNHEITGARIAYTICERLRLSKKERERVVNLIRWHMFSVDEKVTDAGVRRFIRRVGQENVKDIIDLRIGDRLGGGTKAPESWRLKKFKERVEEQLRPGPFSINDMVVDGKDIMKVLGIKPGPKIGEILNKLFAEVDEDLSKNNKEFLLKRIKEV